MEAGSTSSSPFPPEAVEELARRRQSARQAKDYVLADSLRAQISDAGWEAVDRPDGFTLTPRAPSGEGFPAYHAVPALYAEPDGCAHSLCLAYHGWSEDVERLLAGVLNTAAQRVAEVELVLTVVSDEPSTGLLQTRHPALSRAPVAVRVREELGQAQALNVAARRARGRLVHFVEPSLELGWDVLDQSAGFLEDPGIGACGPFGLDTADWREFRAAPAGEVMALEYLLSVRRADLPAIGEMDPGFRFYRNLDLDYSRQVVAAGFRLRSYDARVARHSHRLWEATPAAERDRLSRRNFNRLLDRWVRPAGPGSAPRPPGGTAHQGR